MKVDISNFIVLAILASQNVYIIHQELKSCICTREYFGRAASKRCNYHLLEAFGRANVTECTDGYRYLKDKYGAITDTKCPCERSLWEWIQVTHFGFLCADDANCWYALCLTAFTILMTLATMALNGTTPKVLLVLASMISFNESMTFAWDFGWKTVIVAIILVFGNLFFKFVDWAIKLVVPEYTAGARAQAVVYNGTIGDDRIAPRKTTVTRSSAGRDLRGRFRQQG